MFNMIANGFYDFETNYFQNNQQFFFDYLLPNLLKMKFHISLSAFEKTLRLIIFKIVTD